ncbi:MAG: UDP-N-acetylmuramate--L-alanine ligase [Treponema sp.]
MSQVRLPENLLGYHIHMIGIKGTGMTALAELFVSKGARITGSDVSDEFYTDALLQKIGISVTSPFAVTNIPADTQLVIYSPAYTPEENEELAETIKRKLTIMSYPEALGAFSQYSYSVGIAGVHGKTTTTGIAGTLLQALPLEASVLAGSAISNFNDSCTMIHGSKYFVAETCEYKRHFLSFHPQKIILTGIESDHQDYYPQYEDILTAFLQYINRLPQFSELLYCADDAGARDAAQLIFSSRPDLIFTPYGKTAAGDYGIKIHGIQNGQTVFSLRGFAGEFRVGIPGEHTVLNATAAIALAVSLLKEENPEITVNDLTAIRNALASFKGAKRRSETLGEVNGILFMDDYAHHPTAIKTTLQGLRSFYPNKRIVADFMSHTYSRTAALLDEFASAFSDADTVILHKIYSSAREKYRGGLNGKTLYEQVKKKHKHVYYFEEIMDAEDFVTNELRSGDLFITMGAGDNWKLGKRLYTKMAYKGSSI